MVSSLLGDKVTHGATVNEDGDWGMVEGALEDHERAAAEVVWDAADVQGRWGGHWEVAGVWGLLEGKWGCCWSQGWFQGGQGVNSVRCFLWGIQSFEGGDM